MARIIISLPDKLLEQLDNYLDITAYNRSEFIRLAIRRLMEKKEPYVEILQEK